MGQRQKRFGTHTAIALACLAAYIAITCTVDLLHTEDDPITECDNEPFSAPCPACKFLAGANTTQTLHDATPVAIEYLISTAPAPDSSIVVSRHGSSSIIERAPPIS